MSPSPDFLTPFEISQTHPEGLSTSLTYIYIHMYICIYVYMCICVYVVVYIVCIYIYVHIHIHIYPCVYVHIPVIYRSFFDVAVSIRHPRFLPSGRTRILARSLPRPCRTVPARVGAVFVTFSPCLEHRVHWFLGNAAGTFCFGTFGHYFGHFWRSRWFQVREEEFPEVQHSEQYLFQTPIRHVSGLHCLSESRRRLKSEVQAPFVGH